MFFVYLLSVFGLVHFIKESDITNWVRIQLLRIHPVFFTLLNCYFCLGFWVSLAIYPLVYAGSYRIIDHILWGFGGATVSFFISSLIYSFRNVGGK